MKKLISAMALVVALLSTACSGGGNTAPAPREAAAPTTDTAYRVPCRLPTARA